ncbi:MAG: hypothetical protein KJ697_04610 [Nanoarchaeota archaeon]|nr:hypothetical protein [Nanoarchaeota archaeon]MBU4124498.1 hypothetical protein [Nanoarchaeota archaeon]
MTDEQKRKEKPIQSVMVSENIVCKSVGVSGGQPVFSAEDESFRKNKKTEYK